MKKSIILLFSLVLLLSFVSAHQPRIVYQQTSSFENPFIVQNPEISQAFYGELKGNPDFYLIDSATDFNLYLNILSPDVKNARTDFVVEIIYNKSIILDPIANWTKFYEEFAGDNYFKGPEFEKNVSAGKYIIKISNQNNTGKYSLAIGKIESFPLKDQLKTLAALPKLKIFFEKSPFTAFFNKIGEYLLILIIVIVALILLVYFIIKKIRNNKSKKKR